MPLPFSSFPKEDQYNYGSRTYPRYLIFELSGPQVHPNNLRNQIALADRFYTVQLICNELDPYYKNSLVVYDRLENVIIWEDEIHPL